MRERRWARCDFNGHGNFKGDGVCDIDAGNDHRLRGNN